MSRTCIVLSKVNYSLKIVLVLRSRSSCPTDIHQVIVLDLVNSNRDHFCPRILFIIPGLKVAVELLNVKGKVELTIDSEMLAGRVPSA